MGAVSLAAEVAARDNDKHSKSAKGCSGTDSTTLMKTPAWDLGQPFAQHAG